MLENYGQSSDYTQMDRSQQGRPRKEELQIQTCCQGSKEATWITTRTYVVQQHAAT